MNPPYGGSEKPEIQKNFPSDMRGSETADLFMVLIMNRLKKTGRAAVVVPDGFLFGSGNKTAIKKALVKDFNLHTVVRLPTSVFAPYTSIATNILFFDGTAKPTVKTWFYRVDMPEGYKHFSKTKPMRLEHLKDLSEWWNNREAITMDGADKARAYTPEELEALDYNLDLCGFTKEEEEILPPKELIEKFKTERAAHEKVMDETLAQILAVIGEAK